MSLNTDEAARILGVAAYEVTAVERRRDGWWALQHDMASHVDLWRHVPGWLVVDADLAEPDDAAPVGDVDGDGVPDGPAHEVLSWVHAGTDEAEVQRRAVEAFNAEGDKGKKARKTLLADLEKLAG
jgi:hypothetical protein